MFASKILSVNDISSEQIVQICSLKNQYWQYGIDKQLRWWQDNTDNTDSFSILLKKDLIFAFLRLRERNIQINDFVDNALCITEVCVDQQFSRQGYGKKLMESTTNHIKRCGSKVAFLLCFEEQVKFYQSCNWAKLSTPLIKSIKTNKIRKLSHLEHCMAFDPVKKLNGKITLYGDVF